MHLRKYFAFLCFFTTGLAMGPYHSLGDIFQGQLANLTRNLTGNPYLGSQDMGKCCLLAVNESLEIVDGNLEFTPGQTALHGNMSTFLSFQFPCTASYNGSNGDQPQVTVSYSWCNQNCPGWQKTGGAVGSWATDWLQPLITFILPCMVFCFSIPRRRKLIVPRFLFPSNGLLAFPNGILLLYKVPATLTIIIMDSVLWVSTCIVMAGPMLLSGMLEATMDGRILRFLKAHTDDVSLSVQHRAQLLFIILLGNLDQDPAWDDMKRVISRLPPNSTATREVTNTDANIHSEKIWDTTLDPSSEHPLDSKRPTLATVASQAGWDESAFLNPTQAQYYILALKTQIKSLLECQPSFSSTVGIGVIFFTSSFFYTLIQIQANCGDTGTSHALGFGIFWMTVGHIGVVAGILLAGDNPSAFASVSAATDTQMLGIATKQRKRSLSIRMKDALYRNVYPSNYRLAWMWDRGTNKEMWVARLAAENPHLTTLQTEVLRMGWTGWLVETTVPAVLLFLVPAFLGGITSYTTPTVGIGCVTMIPLLFSSAQMILVALWLCDWKFWKRGTRSTILRMKQKQLIVWSPTNLLWDLAFLLAIFIATFSSLGGTLLQLIGTLQNCLCYILVQDWIRRYSPDVTMYFGANSSEAIYYAQHFWLPIGISAMVFLIVTTIAGWRYQVRLRLDFVELVEDIDKLADGDNYTNLQREKLSPSKTFDTSTTKKGQNSDTITEVSNHESNESTAIESADQMPTTISTANAVTAARHEKSRSVLDEDCTSPTFSSSPRDIKGIAASNETSLDMKISSAAK